jgi:predicted dehydrogenase
MKALVIGTGSIGRRHLVNLQALGLEAYALSERLSRGESHTLPPGCTAVQSWQQLSGMAFDLVVIANRTDQHLDTASKALAVCNALYIEKPLHDRLLGLREFQSLCESRQAVIEMGFMMRSHPNLQWIKSCVESGVLGDIFFARAAVGQWLPDWRPGTDHRQGFGAFYRYGGGVTMELIHEIDLIHYVLGTALDVSAMQARAAVLEIETEAITEISMRLRSGALAQVHLDYVRPGYGRTMEIVGSKAVLAWDYTRSSVTVTQSDGAVVASHVVSEFERNDMFVSAMKHTIERIKNPAIAPKASLADGVHALQVAMASHYSARQRRFVRPDEVPVDFSLVGEHA